MFKNETVFVLGAGASWHYGYPTGEGLVHQISRMAQRLSRHCKYILEHENPNFNIPEYVKQKIKTENDLEQAKTAWESVKKECDTLVDRLRTVRPLLIDHFLAWNENLRPIGQMMIAAVILQCEASGSVSPGNYNHLLTTKGDIRNPRIDSSEINDDWYRFIIHKLVYGCQNPSDLLKNKVRFITFNYDTSLDYHLLRGLSSIDLLGPDITSEFLDNDRIIHVYGSIHPKIPTNSEFIDLKSMKTLGSFELNNLAARAALKPITAALDHCLRAAKTLRTVDPHDKEVNKPSLEMAKYFIQNSSVIYILGYGFDENNNLRIGLDPYLKYSEKNHKSVLFTNFGDVNNINKRVSRLMFGAADRFLSQSIHNHIESIDYAEKSTRTVYEALEKDFESLEG